MKKVVIYLRLSRKSDAKESLEKQLKVCRKYADDHMLEVKNVYSDIGSALKAREGFKQLLIDAKNDNWSYIIVATHDRFAVDMKTIKHECSPLIEKNVSIISATDNRMVNLRELVNSPLSICITD